MSLAVLFITILAFGVLPSVKAGYKFEILLVLYENPEHRTRTGGYCERSNRNNPCDNAFRICVRTRGAPGDACDIRGLETTKIGENDDHLPFSEGQTVGGVRNPITITGDKWPGQVEIRLAVFDNDGGGNVISESSDLITTFVIRPDVVASTDGAYSAKSRYTSHYSALELAFRLTCLPPHSGEHCSELGIDGSSSTFPHSSSMSVLVSSYTTSSKVFSTDLMLPTTTSVEPSSSRVATISTDILLPVRNKTLLLSTQAASPDISVVPTLPHQSHNGTTHSPTVLAGPSVESSSVPPAIIPAVGQPSDTQDLPLSVILAVICVGVITILALIIVIVLLLVMNRRQKKTATFNTRSFDDSAFKPQPDMESTKGKEDKEDHMYEMVTPRRPNRSTATLAAVNAGFNRAVEDDVAVKDNVAYATVSVERNAAYAVIRQRDTRDRPMMPLPRHQ